jgi:hypothetical protein
MLDAKAPETGFGRLDAGRLVAFAWGLSSVFS